MSTLMVSIIPRYWYPYFLSTGIHISSLHVSLYHLYWYPYILPNCIPISCIFVSIYSPYLYPNILPTCIPYLYPYILLMLFSRYIFLVSFSWSLAFLLAHYNFVSTTFVSSASFICINSQFHKVFIPQFLFISLNHF